MHRLISDLLDTGFRRYDTAPSLEFHVHVQLNTLKPLLY